MSRRLTRIDEEKLLKELAVIREEMTCKRCSRPGWSVRHETYDGTVEDHTLDNHYVPADQYKAAKTRHPGVTGSKLFALMAESPRFEMNAA